MGGGISVCNKTGVELLVELSQVGPLHWERVLPGETKEIDCGQVWFTVSAKLWDGNEPSGWEVAAPFLIGIGGGAAIVAGGALVYAAAAPAAAGGAAAGTAAVAGTGTAATGCGCSMSLAGAGANLVGTGIVAPIVGEFAFATVYRQSIGTAKEDAQKWLRITDSVQSANWLAENNVIAVVPVKEAGVYANGKTITVSYDLVSNAGGSRMTLKLSGT